MWEGTPRSGWSMIEREKLSMIITAEYFITLEPRNSSINVSDLHSWMGGFWGSEIEKKKLGQDMRFVAFFIFLRNPQTTCMYLPNVIFNIFYRWGNICLLILFSMNLTCETFGRVALCVCGSCICTSPIFHAFQNSALCQSYVYTKGISVSIFILW